MAEVKLCGVCGKNEMSTACEICGIPLCFLCVRKVSIAEASPTAQALPGVFLSPLRPGVAVKKVCAKCMREADFFEGEYF